MDVGDWLSSLDLGRYEGAFRDSSIDVDVLPDLTDGDLEKLGVILGDRKRLLRAIAALGATDGSATATSPAAAPKSTDVAERRQLTVMFCDLVGSTALSARLDPEDMREVIGAYHHCCADYVARDGGFVAKYMGDGVLAYFGYPQAHEHDAERAVQAALAIVEAAPKLVTVAGSALHVRVGIATGLVVVGDLIGSGEAQERGVVGETPNLAARLQGIADSDMVVIAEGTRRLLGNLFEFQDLGANDLKGIAAPTRAWAALRASSAESRFEALHASGLTALVGREEEFDLLLRRWSKAKSGEGQVVLLSGEAGIGKSRLTAALLECIATEPHIKLRYFCSPQHTDSALYPVIGQMERVARLGRTDEPRSRLDKLDAALTQTSTSVEDAALLAQMLSLPNDGRYPALDLTPQQRRQRTLEALFSQLQALARRNTVLMVFEDAHWSDPTSLELLGRVVHRIASLQVMVIVTFRPEFEPPWPGRPHVNALVINRLARREIDAMIDRVVGDRQLPANIRQDIIERTDGIPLFVEEMTKAVLEAEGEGEARRTAAAIPSPALSVPASLHASLLARLDRLGSAKEVAQIGAAIGREFSHTLLAAVAPKPEGEFEGALDRLVGAGLLFRQGAPPHATYLFKHALVQDAAYGTLLREPRRALHARIAEALESRFAEIAETQPELLARHCTEAGLTAKAAQLWGKAGQRSLARSALAEAAEQLTRALAQIAGLPSTPALRREEIELQVALLTPLMHLKGYGAPETKAAAERARLLIQHAEALGEPPEDPLLLFAVLYGFWAGSFMAFRADSVCELAAQFLALADKQGATGPRMIGHRILGPSLLFSGNIAESRQHLDQAIALYDPAEHRPLGTRFGQDVRVSSLFYRSWAQWMLGYPEAALADAEQMLGDVRELGQAGSLMQALYSAAFPYVYWGNYAAAGALVDELTALVEEKRAGLFKAGAMLNRGWILAVTGKAAEAVDTINAGLTMYRSTGSTLWTGFYMTYLARAYADNGRFDDAWRCVGEVMALIETTEERWFEAEINRVAGEIALSAAAPDPARAQAYFERALTIARAQQAKSWELRASMSLARMWRDQGKPDAARDLLAPVYGLFTEGFATLDLKEAKALLDALAR
jgi:class 3 adenylate cyclase/predicted ATPase